MAHGPTHAPSRTPAQQHSHTHTRGLPGALLCPSMLSIRTCSSLGSRSMGKPVCKHRDETASQGVLVHGRRHRSTREASRRTRTRRAHQKTRRHDQQRGTLHDTRDLSSHQAGAARMPSHITTCACFAAYPDDTHCVPMRGSSICLAATSCHR